MDGLFNFELDFGGFLRRVREEQKLTRKAIANDCGISIQSLYYYETGRRRLKYAKAEKIAGALGYSVAAILDAYGHYDDVIPSWFDGEIDAWEAFKTAVDEDQQKNHFAHEAEEVFITFLRELGYEVTPRMDWGYVIVFPEDGYQLELVDSYAFVSLVDQTKTQIELLLSKLRLDAEREAQKK